MEEAKLQMQIGNPRKLLALCRRHAAAVLALLVRHEAGPAALQAPCSAEMDNAREVNAWAREQDLCMAARLTAVVAAVSKFTVWRQESTGWLLTLLPQMNRRPGRRCRRRCRPRGGRRLHARCRYAATAMARHALALWAPLGEPRRALFANVVRARAVGAAGPELDQACAELQARAVALPELGVHERLHSRPSTAFWATWTSRPRPH